MSPARQFYQQNLFSLSAAQMTTVLDPDPATASHLVGPTEPNFGDWFKCGSPLGSLQVGQERTFFPQMIH